MYLVEQGREILALDLRPRCLVLRGGGGRLLAGGDGGGRGEAGGQAVDVKDGQLLAVLGWAGAYGK